jgi:DNA-binding XRE family transcriptional regulator
VNIKTLDPAPFTFQNTETIIMGKKTNFRQRILLGNRIRQTRIDKSMTLEALASRAEVGIGSISEIERGLRFPNTATLYAIAEALDVPADHLLTGK